MPRRRQAQEGSPTVAARLLANELRQLRIKTGMSQAAVAKELGCTPGRVGHIETRRNQPRRADLLVMLQMYKVPPERQVWYLDLLTKATEKGWWDGAAGIPEWFSAFVGLEWGASEIRNFELGLIPGLLQTREYMTALFQVDAADDQERIDSQVAQRMRRQEALHRKQNPLTLDAVIDEAVLHRIAGGSDVMRDQLAHLLDVAELPNVTLQVLPFGEGPHPAFGGGFHCLEFAATDDPGVIYVETRCGGLYLEEQEEIDEYHSVFARLTDMAMEPTASAALIRKVARDLT